MKKITHCRCCKSKNIFIYLDLGLQPLANSYHKSEKLKKYPLEVMLCRNCFHSQLSIVVDPDEMFKNYLYVSGTTKTFKNHCKSLALDAVRRFKKNNLHVLDIACNDGTQLEFFRNLKCSVMGIDPAENLRSITKKKKIDVIVNYWTTKTAKKLSKKFDIITGTNVFAHVHDLDEFLKAIQLVLHDDGLLILEFPYADKMVIHNEFDTVYHEHLSYFLVNSFKILVERMGFYIVDVLQTPIHGGSIRFFVKRGKGAHSEKIIALIKNEKKSGLFDTQTYKKFSGRVKKNKRDMQTLLKQLRLKNEKVIGYGASAKGNTMINYFKINLEYIVDDNELKWGYLTPGRNIFIKNPQVIKDEKNNLHIVILSWNFFREIADKIRRIRGNKKDVYITYVPQVEKIPVSSKISSRISA